jgi:FkbM family methyltransferase
LIQPPCNRQLLSDASCTLVVSPRYTSQLVDVNMVALDDFYTNEGLNFVDVIKIDTDGHEMSVFNGMNGEQSLGSYTIHSLIHSYHTLVHS